MWHGALSVFRFELRRTMTVSRIAVWLMLILFPVFIVSVIEYHEREIEEEILEELFDTPQTRMQRELAREKPAQSDADAPRETKQARAKAKTDKQKTEDRKPEDAERAPRGVDLPRDAQQAGGGLATDEEAGAEEPPHYMDRLWGVVFFGLIPEVITLFGLLLWVPSLVHAELEGRTWIYLAVRPRGRVSVLLGKYLTAITWTALAGWTSTTVCVLIARPDAAWRLWGTTVALVALACVAYGAIYSLIGVWLHRRAMVIAVAYTLIFEFLVSFIPAVINKFTVQYRLRSLLFTWMDWWHLMPSGTTTLFMGKERAWVHILILCSIVVGILVLAVQVIQRREYATVADA
jgi:hypothetical protein